MHYKTPGGINPPLTMDDFDFGKKLGHDKGAHFRVEIFENYCIKWPKKKSDRENSKKLQQMASIQLELSKQLEEVPPAWKIDTEKGSCVVMATVPGIRTDKIKDKDSDYLRWRVEKVIQKIADCGYTIRDTDVVEGGNVLYDQETDRIYIVDYYRIEPINTEEVIE